MDTITNIIGAYGEHKKKRSVEQTTQNVINTLKTPRQNLVRNSIKSPLPRQLNNNNNMRSASREKLFTPSSRNYSGQKQNVNQDSQSRSKTLYEIMLQKQK